MTSSLNTIPDTGVERKEVGQRQAISGASEWFQDAMEYIKGLARTKEPFTADDLIAIAGLPHKESAPNSNNAVGPVFSWASRKGLIEVTGYRRTKREQGKARMLTVWTGTGVA